MKAAVLEAFHQPLMIRERQIAPPGPGEVTVEVMACGLCQTDIHIADGQVPTVRPPLVPGHEFAGVVGRVGSGVSGWSIGDRVVVCVDVTCGICDFCLRGETNRCSRLTRIGFERDGGMQEQVNVPAANLERLADGVSFEKAAVVPDAVAAIYRAFKVAGVGPGTRLAILGTGGVGLQGVKLAKLFGARCTCTDLDDRKLERARSFGAERTVNPTHENFLEAVRGADGIGFDVVIDNVGRQQSVREAVAACRNGGTVIALGYVDPVLEVPSYDIVIREKRVIGSRAITRAEFRELVGLVNDGSFDPDIGELVPMGAVNEALDKLRQGLYLARTVLVPPFDRWLGATR